jgi:hypothetical protein
MVVPATLQEASTSSPSRVIYVGSTAVSSRGIGYLSFSARASRDKAFRKQTLAALFKRLDEVKPKTVAWKRLERAIVALENMKQK